MFAGIGDMRRYLQEELDKLPDGTEPIERIMTAVEAHLRHELELSDYATASIRNSGQVPEHLRTRQEKETAAYNRIWLKLFTEAAEQGQIRPELDTRIALALVLGALNWAAEWWNPRRTSVDAVVANAQSIVRAGLGPVATPARRKRSTSTGR